jgi:hypothetical protein
VAVVGSIEHWAVEYPDSQYQYAYSPFVVRTSLDNGLAWEEERIVYAPYSAFDLARPILAECDGDLYIGMNAWVFQPADHRYLGGQRIYVDDGWTGGAPTLFDEALVEGGDDPGEDPFDQYPDSYSQLYAATSLDGLACVMVLGGKTQYPGYNYDIYQFFTNGEPIDFISISPIGNIGVLGNVNYPWPWSGLGYTYFF